MKNNEINKGTDRGDFKTQWQRRQQWQEPARKTVPDDETFLRWAEKARHASAEPDVNVIPFPTHRRNRWIPYAAAASILIAVAFIGWQRISGGLRHIELEEVSVEGQTVRFLCNSGCSADDVLHSAQNIITE